MANHPVECRRAERRRVETQILTRQDIQQGEWSFYRDYPHLLEQRGWARYSADDIRSFKKFPPLPKPSQTKE